MLGRDPLRQNGRMYPSSQFWALGKKRCRQKLVFMTSSLCLQPGPDTFRTYIRRLNNTVNLCPRYISIWVGRVWKRCWHPTQVLLPGKSYGRRRLGGYSPWGCQESDTTEQLHFHFSLSCIGEGSGNPLQRSCLENPRDGGAWWAAVYGVAQSWTQLKRLSSSSSGNSTQSK